MKFGFVFYPGSKTAGGPKLRTSSPSAYFESERPKGKRAKQRERGRK